MNYRKEFNGPLNQSKLREYGNLLRDLRSGPCPNGAVVPATMEKAFKDLAAENEHHWCLGLAAEEWAVSNAKRLRAMLRDVQQAFIKSRGKAPPKWLEEFCVDNVLKAEDTPESPEKAAEQPAEPEGTQLDEEGQGYDFGYCDEMNLAWRRDPNEPDSKKHYCKTLRAPAEAKDDDEPEAVWADGVRWRVPGMLCSDVVQKKKTLEVLWSSRNQVGDELFIKASSSKNKEWYILWQNVGGKRVQKMQIATHDRPNEWKKTALDFLTKLGDQYAAGADMETLQNEKQSFLEAAAPRDAAPKAVAKAKASGSSVLKRPAAPPRPPPPPISARPAAAIATGGSLVDSSTEVTKDPPEEGAEEEEASGDEPVDPGAESSEQSDIETHMGAYEAATKRLRMLASGM